VNGDAEHPVAEGEQAVDWIEGRSTGAAGHGTGRKKREPTEVVTGRVSLDAEHFGQRSGSAEVG
jgi:hypothetical protein